MTVRHVALALLAPTRLPPAAMRVATAPAMAAASASAASAALTLKDFTSAAVGFFNNMRVPAALVAAATIKDAFVLQAAPEDVKRSRGWTTLRHSYLLLMMFAFSAEVSCIFTATYAIVLLQASGLDTLAGSVTELMVRELEFEYVAVRQSFVSGVLGFIIAQALRVRFALRKYPDLSKCAMMMLLNTASMLLTYNNGRSIVYGGYVGLIRRSFDMQSRMLISRCASLNPLAWASAITLLLAIGFGVRTAYTLLVYEIDENGDNKISRDELVGFVSRMATAMARTLLPFFPRQRPADQADAGAVAGGSNSSKH